MKSHPHGTRKASFLARLRSISIPALTFGGIGVLLLLVAVWWTVGTARFLIGVIRVPGTVIRNVIVEPITRREERRAGRSDGPTYAPVVHFRGPDGKEIEITGLGSSDEEYKPGEAVYVLHPPGQPQEARIDSNQELWLGPQVVGFFGLIFVAVGYAAARFKF